MKNNEISILGFSAVASLTSLMLADKGITHNYYVERFKTPFLSLPPISNPLTNQKTQQLEKKYISSYYLDKIQYIEEYDFNWHDSNYKQTLHLKGKYKFPIYAIDSRIRFQCFWDALQESPLINVVQCENSDEVLKNVNSMINIIGGGEKFSSLFPDNGNLSRRSFPKKRDLLFFNLGCNESLLKKYSTAKMFFINEIGDITIYPFLHTNGKNALNLVVNIVKGSQWDLFEKSIPSFIALDKLIKLLLPFEAELTRDLADCFLLDTPNYLIKISPYFKIPVTSKNHNILMGVGDTIAKNDPITGQGYNSGSDIACELVKHINAYIKHLNKEEFIHSYNEYVRTMLEYLYHMNLAFTQNVYNSHIVYEEASNNVFLRNYVISAFEDISLYFPWLVDEEESVKLIEKHQKILSLGSER